MTASEQLAEVCRLAKCLCYDGTLTAEEASRVKDASTILLSVQHLYENRKHQKHSTAPVVHRHD